MKIYLKMRLEQAFQNFTIRERSEKVNSSMTMAIILSLKWRGLLLLLYFFFTLILQLYLQLQVLLNGRTSIQNCLILRNQKRLFKQCWTVVNFRRDYLLKRLSMNYRKKDKWSIPLLSSVSANVATIQVLTERNLPFLGSDEHIGTPYNGTILGVIELLGKFDKIIQKHIRKVHNKEIPDHYLGKNMQNELTDIMGKSVQREIMFRIKTAKYYAIIIDCIPDISHQ